ncbi:MAG: DUF1622 domain-containing protein [Caldilineaceae bacterium]|nr:DUF1622 domain-containing protein [Caldilineaceae bacterium]
MFHEAEQNILNIIELVALVIEVIAVTIIVLAVFFGLFRYIRHLSKARHGTDERFANYKATLGHALLLGLEILVAADIIKTVALETTLESVSVLGLLVIIRIFLGWSLMVEIDGRWPWQAARPEANPLPVSDDGKRIPDA